jgi:formylglycine-generating enzyme required for sulfatase activity
LRLFSREFIRRATMTRSHARNIICTPLELNADLIMAEIKINERDGAEMVWVPKGEFILGGDAVLDSALPRHTANTGGYWIYKYSVTVAQYMRYSAEMGVVRPVPPDWGYHDDHPVVNVSWNDAASYCEWAGVSLPSEVEWEKAARGTDGRAFPWGNDWDPSRCANSVATRRHGTAPVTEHRGGVSPFGVWDMAGNAWEWCADWYVEGKYRALRGGGWTFYHTGIYGCACRSGIGPDYSDYVIGFRCVLRPLPE